MQINDMDMDIIKLQDEEVESISFLSIDEINKIIDEGCFLESHAYIFRKYIDV